jgi:arginase
MPTNRLDTASTHAAFAAPPVVRPPAVTVAVPSGVGAKDRRCEAGPLELLDAGLLERLAARGVDISRGPTVSPLSFKSPHAVIADLGHRLAREVSDVLDNGGFPLVLGGDHSCAIGTWNGVATALATKGPVGLVWIDAHMDSHTSATSWTGRVHGMPLAALLGQGSDPRMGGRVLSIAHQGPLQAANVCLVGIRSYEPEESALLAQLGVRVIGMEEVTRRGIAAVLADAVEIVSTGTAGYGFSIDMDAVDPEEAPGVGTPEPGGLSGVELVRALERYRGDASLVTLEIVEYNPRLDPKGLTARLVEDMAVALLAAG